jgi:metallophosphoesterase (TIGR00282 family)
MIFDGEKSQTLLRVLMLGEVYSKAGRKAVAEQLPRLRQQQQVDMVIANGESAAGGYGLTVGLVEELRQAGVDVVTTGSRVFDQREMVEWLRQNPDGRVVRPLNYPPGTPGQATCTVQTAKGPVEVLNLNGRVYFNEMDSPFRVMDRWLEERQAAGGQVPLVVDFHAEATSEKVVLGWYLDGRVSAVLGTHTRTPTADARLLHRGTAHVSDVGMIGPYDSLAGLEVTSALKPFVSHITVRPRANKRPTNGPVVWNSVLVDLEPQSGQAVAISRLDLMLDDESM